MNIGFNIKSIRENRHFTQRELALKIGCTTAYISQIERGSRNINLLMALTISKILDCSLYDLVGESECE